MSELAYLACPYSDPDPLVKEQRFIASAKAAARLMRDGVHVFSPITHCHPMAVAGGVAGRLGILGSVRPHHALTL